MVKKNVRDFEYSESSIEMDLDNVGWDIHRNVYEWCCDCQ